MVPLRAVFGMPRPNSYCVAGYLAKQFWPMMGLLNFMLPAFIRSTADRNPKTAERSKPELQRVVRGYHFEL